MVGALRRVARPPGHAGRRLLPAYLTGVLAEVGIRVSCRCQARRPNSPPVADRYRSLPCRMWICSGGTGVNTVRLCCQSIPVMSAKPSPGCVGRLPCTANAGQNRRASAAAGKGACGRQHDLDRGLKIPLKGVLSGQAPVLRRFDTRPGGRLESPHTVIAVGLQKRLQFALQPSATITCGRSASICSL